MNRFDSTLYRWVFHQDPPSSDTIPVAKSDEVIAREVVMNLARGDTCLQLGLYVTEEQAEARRQKVNAYRPSA
jgi:hypothetical protein